MVNMFGKILHIFKGWYYDFIDFNPKLMEDRMEICNRCSSNKRITKSVSICAECGCPLKKKTRVKEESCLLGKW